MRPTPIPPLPPGTALAHYRVESRLGEGEMGTVYRARDTALDREVGLKVLRPDVGEDQHFVRRFVREARAAARVSHPNLTHIYFVGEQGGRHFFAMELIAGRDLEAYVREHGALEVDEAIEILIQAARGLQAAHRAGVVHRDVKPSNMLLQPDGMVRITDFGLAKSLDANVEASAAGLVIGTPSYMSPEQCRGREVDARTDVYALGLTGFFLLTGRRPFDSTSIGAVIDDQMNRPLPSMADLRPEVPQAVEDALRAMSAKRPDDRPRDMQRVIELLEACRPRPIQPATLAGRAVAAAIDLLLAVTVVAVVEFAASRLFGAPGFVDSFWGTFLLSAAYAAYMIGAEWRWRGTFGKWALALAVVSAQGARPPRRAAVSRFLLRYPLVAWEMLGLSDLGPLLANVGFALQGAAILAGLVLFLVARRRTLSDIATRTRVVIALEPEPPEPPEPR